MIDGTMVSGKRRSTLLTLIVGATLIAAAQAQAQQPTYPAQSYPTPPPPYPNPSYPTAPTYPNPAYAQPGYPNQGYPANTQAYPGYPNPATAPPPQSHFFRNLFAQTLAVVLQTTSGGLISAIAGRLMEWFARKGATANPNVAYASTAAYSGTAFPTASYPTGAQAYPGAPQAYPGAPQAYPGAPQTYPGAPQTYPTQATAYPTAAQTPGAYPSATPNYPAPAPAYPGTAYPTGAYPTAPQTPGAYPGAAPNYPSTAAPAYATAAQTPGAYPGAPQPYPSQTTAYPSAAYPQPDAAAQAYAAPSQVYDARTGQLVTGAANPYTTRGLGMENAIYAGIAYEVQAIGADGHSAPVNTATYEFHTGDKFMVYYRPSLPGHMEIYNVNATGQQTLIDSSNMAAGQMTTLGPYQFTNQTGDETLRLVLSPCSSPQLLAATRDIVKMDAPAQASAPPASTAGPLKLSSCGTPAARGVDVHTRDIEKVGVEGTTSFALDPISPKEMGSGQLTPRQAIIVFHHR